MNVDHSMAGDLREHVVKKWQSGIEVTGAIDIEVDAELDLSFGSVAMNGSLTHAILSLQKSWICFERLDESCHRTQAVRSLAAFAEQCRLEDRRYSPGFGQSLY